MNHRMTTLPLLIAAVLTALPSHRLVAQAGPAHPPATAAPPAPHILLNGSDMAWGSGPASLPPGARATLIEGNPAEAGPFTLRLLLPDGYRIMPHSHPGVEHVTVLSGAFHIGTGDAADFERMKALRVGGFMAMPPRSVHYARAEGETVVQLHGIGPWAIDYVNPADDPRRR